MTIWRPRLPETKFIGGKGEATERRQYAHLKVITIPHRMNPLPFASETEVDISLPRIESIARRQWIRAIYQHVHVLRQIYCPLRGD